jgi:hypothetical protein
VLLDGVSKSLFCGIGQFAVLQQIGDFEEVAVLGQLLDGVAAIQQLALVTVDEGDFGLATGGGQETGVVGEIPGLSAQGANIDTSLPCVPDMIGNSTDLPSTVSAAVRCVVMFWSLFPVETPAP